MAKSIVFKDVNDKSSVQDKEIVISETKNVTTNEVVTVRALLITHRNLRIQINKLNTDLERVTKMITDIEKDLKLKPKDVEALPLS